MLAKPDGDKITLEPARQAMMVLAEYDCTDENTVDKLAKAVEVRVEGEGVMEEISLTHSFQLTLQMMDNAHSFDMDVRVSVAQLQVRAWRC